MSDTKAGTTATSSDDAVAWRQRHGYQTEDMSEPFIEWTYFHERPEPHPDPAYEAARQTQPLYLSPPPSPERSEVSGSDGRDPKVSLPIVCRKTGAECAYAKADENKVIAALHAAKGAIKILGCHMTSGVGLEGKNEVLAQIDAAMAQLTASNKKKSLTKD